jgi:acyl-CoA reductase-like NAD-dependent aldehyde dehydrogenase
VTEEFCALARAMHAREAVLPATTTGPIQNKAQLDKVVDYLADAQAHGKVLTEATHSIGSLVE